jgi:hypothetical protein
MSEEGEDSWQDLKENHRAGSHEVNNRNFHQVTESALLDIVVGLVPSKMKEETTNNNLRAINIVALTTPGTFARTDRGNMIVINMDRLAPYERTAQDERP